MIASRSRAPAHPTGTTMRDRETAGQRNSSRYPVLAGSRTSHPKVLVLRNITGTDIGGAARSAGTWVTSCGATRHGTDVINGQAADKSTNHLSNQINIVCPETERAAIDLSTFHQVTAGETAPVTTATPTEQPTSGPATPPTSAAAGPRSDHPARRTGREARCPERSRVLIDLADQERFAAAEGHPAQRKPRGPTLGSSAQARTTGPSSVDARIYQPSSQSQPSARIDQKLSVSSRQLTVGVTSPVITATSTR